jgi:hypothetical protein
MISISQTSKVSKSVHMLIPVTTKTENEDVAIKAMTLLIDSNQIWDDITCQFFLERSCFYLIKARSSW